MPRNESCGRVYWLETCSPPQFPRLSGDVNVDVAIIGAGIVGVSTARALKDRGFTVAVVEAMRVGQGVSGRATAKVTSQHGLCYAKLEDKFDEERAGLYADAQQAGLKLIREAPSKYGFDADLETKNAFVYTCAEKHVEDIEKEAEVARRLGIPATLTRDAGLPYGVLAAMRFDDQADFHPVKYVAGLAATIPGDGSHVFEHSRVTNWELTRIATDAGSVKARHVVMATNLPLGKVGSYYATNFPMAEPVIAAPIDRAPPGYYKNVEQPSHSMRTHRFNGRTYAVAAGSHFTPGQLADQETNFADLERWLTECFAAGPIEYRWVNEDYDPVDAAPFIGWSSTDSKEAYLVATGFAAWGFTNGAAAGLLIADLIEGKDNPWLKLFDASRVKPLAGAKEFVKGNVAAAKDLVSGHFAKRPDSFASLEPGHGAVLDIDGEEVAAFRDESGTVHAVSAVCTHMGCTLGWNGTDRTWDCPCHGSRFAVSGEVLHGPAVGALSDKKALIPKEGAA